MIHLLTSSLIYFELSEIFCHIIHSFFLFFNSSLLAVIFACSYKAIDSLSDISIASLTDCCASAGFSVGSSALFYMNQNCTKNLNFNVFKHRFSSTTFLSIYYVFRFLVFAFGKSCVVTACHNL